MKILKKFFLLSLSLFMTNCSTSNSTELVLTNQVEKASIASKTIVNEVIIKLKKGVNAVQYAKDNKLALITKIGLDMYLFRGTINKNNLKNSQVTWLEDNKVISLPKLETKEAPDIKTIKKREGDLPNDPFLPVQYGVSITGTDKVWKTQKGSSNVIVAVIDSGIDANHPEFEGQLLNGWDFTVKPPIEGGNRDKYGHGTHVAGVIGAKINNGIGISGMAPNCKLLPVRIFNDFGHSSDGVAAAAVIWAVDHGAKVINASWGSPLPGQALHDAVKYALEKDVVFVAAVGNSGNNDPDSAGYPGKSPGVLAVAATTDIDGWASFSTYGDQVTIAAPGKAILSTYPLSLGNGYRIMEGTSMAAPLVSGAAALIRSQFPNLKQNEVKDLLEKTAKDVIMTGIDQYSGHGRVDVEKAFLSKLK